MKVRVTKGAGWYEWIHPSKATTHVAYVYENGSVYIPEEGVELDDFLIAVSNGKAYRLVRIEGPE